MSLRLPSGASVRRRILARHGWTRWKEFLPATMNRKNRPNLLPFYVSDSPPHNKKNVHVKMAILFCICELRNRFCGGDEEGEEVGEFEAVRSGEKQWGDFRQCVWEAGGHTSISRRCWSCWGGRFLISCSCSFCVALLNLCTLFRGLYLWISSAPPAVEICSYCLLNQLNLLTLSRLKII